MLKSNASPRRPRLSNWAEKQIQSYATYRKNIVNISDNCIFKAKCIIMAKRAST